MFGHYSASSGFSGCRWKTDGEFISSLLWSSMGGFTKSGNLRSWSCRGRNVFCSLVLRASHIIHEMELMGRTIFGRYRPLNNGVVML